MNTQAITTPTAERKAEIRSLLALSPDEVRERAGDRLAVYDNLDQLHRSMAEDIASEIERNNAAERSTNLILPVGPTGQYPYLLEIVSERKITLRNCRFFFMDEYLGEDGKAVPAEHPLSFKGIARCVFLDRLEPELAPPVERVIFPDENNVAGLAERIAKAGGIDACFGGIGIHGHVAFNEPETSVAESDPRTVRLNDYTVTINAVRAEVGGNLECFPREAFTLGMRQILAARRIVLACRNGTPYDWANTVLRLALFGKPGDDYPVTHLRGREYKILTDEETLACPRFLV